MLQQDLTKRIADTARGLDQKFSEYTSELEHNNLKFNVETIMGTMATQE
jgi:hypothetical protein